MLGPHRLSGLRQLAKLARSSVAVRCMSSKGHDDYHDHHGKSAVQTAKDVRGTISDLPVPQGSFQEYHSKRNSFYNMMLAGESSRSSPYSS